jgi:hypothetical protein
MYLFQAPRQSVLVSRHGNEMHMIGHETVADEFHTMSLDSLS